MGISRRRAIAAGAVAAATAGAGYLWLRRDRPESPPPDGLAILSGYDESEGGQRHQLVEQWQEVSGYQARIIDIGGVADAHRSEMVALAQSDEYTVDVFNLDVTWIAEFAEAGYIRPLDIPESRLEGFLEQPLRACEYDGERWALPFNTDAGLLFYRSGLVLEPPTDWGGLEARVGEVFADEQRRRGLAAGYASQLADYEGLTVNALEMIWAEHGELVRGDWRDPMIDLDTPQVRDAFHRLARVYANEDPKLILRDSVTFDETATTSVFSDRKVLFMRNWPIAFRNLQRAADDDTAPRPDWFDVVPLPGPSVLGGQNLAIARHSRSPRAAQALIEHLTSEESQLRLFRDGGLAATRRAVYEHEEVLARHPYAPQLLNAVDQAKLRPVTPHYARFSEAFRAGVRHVMASDGEPPDGLAERLADALRGLSR